MSGSGVEGFPLVGASRNAFCDNKHEKQQKTLLKPIRIGHRSGILAFSPCQHEYME